MIKSEWMSLKVAPIQYRIESNMALFQVYMPGRTTDKKAGDGKFESLL